MTTDCIFENVNILFQNRRPFESVWVETSIFCGKIILLGFRNQSPNSIQVRRVTLKTTLLCICHKFFCDFGKKRQRDNWPSALLTNRRYSKEMKICQIKQGNLGFFLTKRLLWNVSFNRLWDLGWVYSSNLSIMDNTHKWSLQQTG